MAIYQKTSTGEFAKVQSGDNLTKIANSFGVSVNDLAKYNNIADPNKISPNQIINKPPTAVKQTTKSVSPAVTTSTRTVPLGPVQLPTSQGSPAPTSTRNLSDFSMKDVFSNIAAPFKSGAVSDAFANIPSLKPKPTEAPVKTAVPTAGAQVDQPQPQANIYKVVGGDTLGKIAQRNGVSLDSILKANPQFQKNPDLIKIGQSVVIPTKGVVSPFNGTGPQTSFGTQPTKDTTPLAPTDMNTTPPPDMGGSDSLFQTSGLNIQENAPQYQQETPQAPQVNPADAFNSLTMDLLKEAQGVDTNELLMRKRALDRAVIGEADKITPEEMRTLSPSQQAAIRSGNIKALEPDIDENAYQLKKAQTAIDNFEKVYAEAQKFGGEFAEKMVAPDSVINSYKAAIESQGLESASTILAGANDKTKEKVLSSLDYNKISGAGGAGKLTPAQINTTVNSIAGAFDNEPIVKAYNTVAEGANTIKSIGTETKNPADDIAFIYAFAKIMDPNSVVREGEYNTIQKYAQTWADNFGFKAKRIFSNTNFLSSDAKKNMLNVLEAKKKSITDQYNQVRSEYQRQIDDAYAGNARSITQYQVPQSGGGNVPAGGDIFNTPWL